MADGYPIYMVELVVIPILNKRRPNWGYVEQRAFIERLVIDFENLTPSDDKIKKLANKILDNEDKNR